MGWADEQTKLHFVEMADGAKVIALVRVRVRVGVRGRGRGRVGVRVRG